MFPLGTVLLPFAPLPLRVFEPRYRVLTMRCLEGDRRFGVALIERGREVGGGDARFDVGTVAHILQAVDRPDGTWGLATIGTQRIKVVEWLPDDPHPVAEVEEWPDEDDQAGAGDRAKPLDQLVAHLRRLLALQAEVGLPAPPATIELNEDPDVALWQVCGLVPAGPVDRLRLLRAPGPHRRKAILGELLDDAEVLLSHRLQ
jgi:Lon protease-like protein